MKHVFFYDETEHSRKINYETVTATNYHDNFITGIVGWKIEENKYVSDRYVAFESKYDYRKKDGELKSQTMKTKDFRLGFASLNSHTIGFYEDIAHQNHGQRRLSIRSIPLSIRTNSIFCTATISKYRTYKEEQYALRLWLW